MGADDDNDNKKDENVANPFNLITDLDDPQLNRVTWVRAADLVWR